MATRPVAQGHDDLPTDSRQVHAPDFTSETFGPDSRQIIGLNPQTGFTEPIEAAQETAAQLMERLGFSRLDFVGDNPTVPQADRIDDSSTARSDAAPSSVTNKESARQFRQYSPKFLPGLEIDLTEEAESYDPQKAEKLPEKAASAKDDIFGDNADGNDHADDKKTKEKKTDDVDQKFVDVKDELPEDNELAAEESNDTTSSFEALTALAKETIKSPEELVKFSENLDLFEKRAQSDDLSKKDREEFYGQVGRVLEESKTGNKLYSSNELQTVASDLVQQAAKPGDVDQGSSSTCTTAALETVLYIQEPATIARLVADISLTGRYDTTDGGVETVPAINLHPDKYKADTPIEKARSLASHIAQPALINIHWNRQSTFSGEGEKLGKIRYEEGHPTETKGDGHSRMMDYSKTPPEPFTISVGYKDPTNPGSLGFREKPVPVEGPIMYMEYLPEIYKQLRGNKGDLTIVNDLPGKGVIKPDSPEHFKKIMHDATDRKKPVILGVYANKDPLLSDLNDSYTDKPLSPEQKQKAATMHAHHALVGTKTDKKDMATVQNQWGNKVDHTGEIGEKAKLSLDALYDTIIPKAEPAPLKDAVPNTPDEPTPDEYIKSQRDFVQELEKDKDVDPSVLFSERMTFHKYLSHWGHKDEAHTEAEILSSELTARFKSDKGIDKSFKQDASSFLMQMDAAGEKELSKQALKLLDERFKQINPSDSFDYNEEFSSMLRLHKEAGDLDGGKALAHDAVTNILERYGGPENIGSKKALGTLGDVGDMLEYRQFPDEVIRIGERLISNIRTYERANGSDNKTVVIAKQALLFYGRNDPIPDIRKTAAKETQESYDRLKSKGDISSEMSLEMRFGLSHFYESTKDPKSLNSLTEDVIKHLADNNKLGKRDRDSKDFIQVYQHQAERLNKAGGVEFAIPLQERALKIAMANRDPTGDFDKTESIAIELVRMLNSVGRTSDADKVIKDTGVEISPRMRRKGLAQIT